jgi:hypothetical protein
MFWSLRKMDIKSYFHNMATESKTLAGKKGKSSLEWVGSLKAILEKLLSDYEWNVDNKWMGNNYYLRINYNSQTLSKGEINQIFIEQLPSAIGANIEKSKVKKEALCLSLESSNMSLKEAVDRVAMNKIMRQGNDLKIHSVKLTDLAGLVTLNSSYILRMENLPLESNRFDFNLNIRSKAQLIRDLETYGFIVEECFVEKELVKLLDLAK